MKHYLLKSVIALCLTLGTYAMAAAQTTVYGCVSSSMGCSTGSFETESVNMETTTAVTTIDDLDGVDEMLCGVTVGNRYYAFYTDSEDYSTCFGSVNFETGEVVKVKTYANSDAPSVMGMAYDETTGNLYALAYVRALDGDGDMQTQLATIELTTGKLSCVASYEESASYDGFTADGKGGFYWLHNTSKYDSESRKMINRSTLYQLTTDGTRTAIFEEVETTASATSSNQMLVQADGTILYVKNMKVFVVDPAAKTIVQTGTLNKSFVGLTYSKSNESAEPGAVEEKPDMRRLVRITTYGDSMGNVSNDQDMTKTEYFYGPDGRVTRTVIYSRGFDDTTRQPTDYRITYLHKYDFSADGLTGTCTKYQYGQYDFGDFGWKEQINTAESYRYDELGRKVEEVISGYIYTYEYDEDGNLIKSVKTSKTTGKVSQTITYSEFVGKNKPGRIMSDGLYDTYKYVSICQYDDNGNKVAEYQTLDGSIETLKQMEKWEYEGTFLKLYTRNTIDAEGNPVPASKTEYEMVDGNPDCIKYTAYSWNASKESWTPSGRPGMNEFVDFTGMTEQVATTLAAAPIEGTINNVKLTMTIPQIAYYGACNINVYRDGELIATKSVFDMINNEEGDNFGEPTLTYTDEGVYNGQHDYFVQPLAGSGDEFGEEMTYTGYNISNIATVTAALDLPAVIDLKAESKCKGSNNEDIVTFTWSNPEYPEEYGFISNALYFDKAQLAEADTTDAKATSIKGNPWKDTHMVYVMTRYKYGKAFSDTIEVKVSDIPVGTGIDAIKAGAEVMLNGKELRLGEGADIAIYSLGGRLETKAANATVMNLNMLNNGTYIVCLTKNGKTSAYKMVLK